MIIGTSRRRQPEPCGHPADGIAFGFTIRGGKIVEIDLVADPARIRQLALEVLGE